ncbi:hypothetical protein MSAN_01326300 [Mycena sanguinolenta]|uniref:Transmembrane protein n=1 Tax=Mycena sanguinolenta TaxID=230812 RepID=A0A8H6YCP9_9AGAR|nr:hypothetical protein MSAN_01326300 [Mycena sanguinolenta]
MDPCDPRSLSTLDVGLESTDRAPPTIEDDDVDAAAVLLPMTQKGPRTSWLGMTQTLRASAFILHSVLIGTHLLLIGIGAANLQHRSTIPIEHQHLASYLITTTTTTFGTIYAAVVVFVTQILATRHNLQMDQMLTTTHDNGAAWAGIGGAIFLLWNRRKASCGPLIGVLVVIIYLTAILGLHITSSSLFSVAAFNSTRTFEADTKGLPAFNGTPDDEVQNDMFSYVLGSLYFLPSILENEANQGLYGGTLYDVLDNTSTVPGNATVSATGFNVTCGFLAVSQLILSTEGGQYSSQDISISSTQPGMISTSPMTVQGEIPFYSTIPIVDSSGAQGQLVALSPPMNTSVSAIQIFQCSLSLVTQIAVINSQTNQLITLEPDLNKTVSKWTPYTGIPALWGNWPYSNITGNLFIDLVGVSAFVLPALILDIQWQPWYQALPLSDFYLDYSSLDSATASVGDIYLIQKLNLPAAKHSDTANITLHDLENALSTLVASMFWTLGHVHSSYRSNDELGYSQIINGTRSTDLDDLPIPPILLAGKASVTEVFTETRLELSIIAVLAGLVVSLVLMALVLPLLQASRFDGDLPIHGTGILHAIWLYRNHPDLPRTLEQVEFPTDENLGAAGMVRTRLVGSPLLR